MAGYREHITVSAMLGVAYGVGMSAFGTLNFVQGALAGWLTALGGMLPDLDSPTSRPVRELFGLVAGVAPLLLAGKMLQGLNLPAGRESVMLTIILMYLAIRYGGADLIKHFAKHRGMFHSIPAVLIAAELVFLGYPSDSDWVKLIMAVGVCIGMFSHLLLDEIYSVEMRNGRVRLKSSSGTALKWSSPNFTPNVLTYAIVMVLTFGIMTQQGWIAADEPPQPGGVQTLPVAEDHLGLPTRFTR